jgi:hypothetical protein
VNNVPSSASKETQEFLLAAGSKIECKNPEDFQCSETNVMHVLFVEALNS